MTPGRVSHFESLAQRLCCGCGCRFELDIIIEANLATIRCLDMVVKTLEEQTPEKRKAYKFDVQTCGGSSQTIHRSAVKRLYGERVTEVITTRFSAYFLLFGTFRFLT